MIIWEELHVRFEKSFFVCLLTGPLVRIKQALTRLKQEVTQMDVRIGVVRVVFLNIYQHLMLNILECRASFKLRCCHTKDLAVAIMFANIKYW